MLNEVFVVYYESVVHVSVECEVKGGVLEEVVMELVPRMLDEGDGNVA